MWKKSTAPAPQLFGGRNTHAIRKNVRARFAKFRSTIFNRKQVNRQLNYGKEEYEILLDTNLNFRRSDEPCEISDLDDDSKMESSDESIPLAETGTFEQKKSFKITFLMEGMIPDDSDASDIQNSAPSTEDQKLSKGKNSSLNRTDLAPYNHGKRMRKVIDNAPSSGFKDAPSLVGIDWDEEISSYESIWAAEESSLIEYDNNSHVGRMLDYKHTQMIKCIDFDLKLSSKLAASRKAALMQKKPRIFEYYPSKIKFIDFDLKLSNELAASRKAALKRKKWRFSAQEYIQFYVGSLLVTATMVQFILIAFRGWSYHGSTCYFASCFL